MPGSDKSCTYCGEIPLLRLVPLELYLSVQISNAEWSKKDLSYFIRLKGCVLVMMPMVPGWGGIWTNSVSRYLHVMNMLCSRVIVGWLRTRVTECWSKSCPLHKVMSRINYESELCASRIGYFQMVLVTSPIAQRGASFTF